MNNFGDLFFLMFNLSQMSDSDNVTTLFCESISEIFQPLHFIFTTNHLNDAVYSEEINSRNISYGHICSNIKPSNEVIQMVQNATQLLAVILDRLRVEDKLNTRVSSLETIGKKQLEDLRESQRIAHVGSWHLDVATNEVIMSEQLYKMFGFDPSLPPPLSPEFQKLFTPESWSLLSTTLAETRDEGLPCTLELQTIRKDGSNGWMWVHGEAEREAEGVITELKGAAQDITVRKQAEDTLRRQEAMQAKMVANIADVIVIIDRDGINRYKSPNIEKRFGWKPEEVVGAGALNNVHSDDLDAARKLIASLMGTPNATGTFECRYLCKDGSYKWIEFTGISLLNDPDICGILGNYHDITERKQAEQALRESEEMMLNSQSVAQICSYSTNLNVNELEKSAWVCSQEFYKIFGIDETYPHTIDGWANFIHPDYRKELFDYHESVVKEGKSFSREYKIIRINDGAERWVHGTGKLEFDEKGNPVRMHGAIQDITEHKSLEDQFRQAQKMEAVGQLAGGVAHDFNNKLQVILGHTEMALPNVSPEDCLHRDLIEIQKAAMHSADLTRQLLAFARKETITPLVLDLNAVTGNLLSMLRRLIGEDIDLHWEPSEKLWAIYMDPTQIDQILTNLCVNARDAIDGVGEINITTANTTLDEVPSTETCLPGEYVQLSFSDTGCGMDRETLAKIFDPFFTTKGLGKGTGLGLSTLYGIAQQNKGFITVDSTLGKGTTFKIYLPCRADEEVAAEKAAETKPTERGQETVLLVEDDTDLLELGKRLLEGVGYTVLSAPLPEEALRIAKEYTKTIDLVLTDMIMPGMNGHDLAIELKELIPDLKCLFMSGYPDETIAQDNVLTEGTQFIQKPFSIRDIAAKLRDVLDA